MKKDLYVNISFDDFCPIWYNWNFEYKNIKSLFDIIESYNLKVTFYTVPNWQGVLENKFASLIKRRLHLLWVKFLKFKKLNSDNQIYNFKDWLLKINKLIDNNKIEICFHWYNHYQPYEILQAEFHKINKKETEEKINRAIDIFKKSFNKFTMCFRPPWWWVNPYLKDVLLKYNFKYFSLKPKLDNIEFEKNLGIFHIPQHYSIEDRNIDKYIENLQNNIWNKNYFFIKWHLDPKLENWLNENSFNNLIKIIEKLNKFFKVESIFVNIIESLFLNKKLKWVIIK